jgi:hypothetical protein
MIPIQYRYATLFSGEGWMPLVPVEKQVVYASLWTDGPLRLWTLVNRSGMEIEGDMLKTDVKQGQLYFGLIAGARIKLEQA